MSNSAYLDETRKSPISPHISTGYFQEPTKLEPPPHGYPYILIHIGSQVKIRQRQNISIERICQSYWILIQNLHATHLLKLLDTMCKYEMDQASIVEDTGRTRFCPQTDRRTNGQTDRRTRRNQYTPFNFVNKIFLTCGRQYLWHWSRIFNAR